MREKELVCIIITIILLSGMPSRVALTCGRNAICVLDGEDLCLSAFTSLSELGSEE